MKKLLSFFISIVIVIMSFFSVGFTAQAAVYEPDTTIYADSYMLINLDDSSFPVVAQKNQDKLKYPASLTKIITAMVAINNVDDIKATTKISKNAIESLYGTGAQVAGLKIGGEITVEDLLYLAMVHSACDACNVLAEYVAGSIDKFVKMMNEWVTSLGCENTHFVNCDGLHDENQYTTASDMAKISLEAVKNETFMKISSTVNFTYDGVNFIHTNLMLHPSYVTYYYEYAQGIKTGSTEQAGYCVITKASKNGYNYLAIVMDSPKRTIDGIMTKCSFIDAKHLFEWAFNSIKYSTVVRKNEVAYEVPVNNGKDADTVQLIVGEDVTTLVPSALDPSNVFIKPVDPPESLDAPVTKGDPICKADIIYADNTIVTIDLVAADTVELSAFLKFLNLLKKFFTNKFVIAVIVILLLGFIGYIAYFVYRLKKDKKRIEAKRRQQEELDRQLYGEDDYIPPTKR